MPRSPPTLGHQPPDALTRGSIRRRPLCRRLAGGPDAMPAPAARRFGLFRAPWRVGMGSSNSGHPSRFPSQNSFSLPRSWVFLAAAHAQRQTFEKAFVLSPLHPLPPQPSARSFHRSCHCVPVALPPTCCCCCCCPSPEPCSRRPVCCTALSDLQPSLRPASICDTSPAPTYLPQRLP